LQLAALRWDSLQSIEEIAAAMKRSKVSLLPLRRRRRVWFPMRANVTAVALLAMLQEERNVVKLPLCQKA
jgi:hypothetical protein